MKKILLILLLTSTAYSHAADYAIGCGAQIARYSNTLLKEVADKSYQALLGSKCQLIINTKPQYNKWLPALPNVSVSILDNEFFNGFNQRSKIHNLDVHWPIYRTADYEAGLYVEYNNNHLPFSPTDSSLNHWQNNNTVSGQQHFKHKEISISAYSLLPNNKLINEVGWGFNRAQATSIINQPTVHNDSLVDLELSSWFAYLEHRAQNLGWDMPFKFALHYGKYWNTQKSSQSIHTDMLSMQFKVGLSYAYRIDYKWTLRLLAQQDLQTKLSPIQDSKHYNKNYFTWQSLGEISLYYHF